MTRGSATKISSAALLSLITTTVVVDLMDATTAANEDTSDWGCVAAAAEYRHIGNVNSVPNTLIEGESLLVLYHSAEVVPKMARALPKLMRSVHHLKCRVSIFHFFV